MATRQRRGPTFIQRSRQVSSADKALFHQVLGAGKSRVKRPFLDLSAEDLAALTEKLGGLWQASIEKNLRG